MRINAINNNQNFKGYKNLLSNTYQDFGHTDKFSYMCFELDNIGTKDLDKWYEIQDKLMPNKPKSNFLIVHNLSSFDVTTIGTADVNLHLDTKKINPENEKVYLKTYSLIASLTDRVSKAPHHLEDKNLSFSYINLFKNLKDIFPTNNIAEYLTHLTTKKAVKHYVTADIINSSINKAMYKYFKLI